jgi:hypothetical protein
VNLRSTHETELAESYPAHVVCSWMGHTRAVSAKHYLQVTEAHVEQAANSVARPLAQQAIANDCTVSPETALAQSGTPKAGFLVGHTGLEPVTSCVSCNTPRWRFAAKLPRNIGGFTRILSRF